MSQPTPADGRPSLDAARLSQAFSVLSKRRRREVLSYLRHHPSLSLATLADGVAEREVGAPLEELDERTVTTVYLSLYHTHVPRLEDAGLVSYDQERDWIRRRDDPLWESVSSLFDSVPAARSDE